MNLSFSSFLRLPLATLISMSALSAHAAGPLAIPNAAIQSNAASAGNSVNNMSVEDRKRLLAAPEEELPSSAAAGGWILKNDSRCNELEQQIQRAKTTAPATAPGSAYQPANDNGADNGLQYDERSRLEARYRSECNK